MITQPLDENICQQRISDFINDNGNWDKPDLNEFLPAQFVEQIVMLPPPRVTDMDVVFTWKASADEAFTTKSACLAIKPVINHPRQNNFDLVWKWPDPKRVRLFLWKALHSVLLTNAERARRHMTDCDLCPILRWFFSNSPS